MIVIHEVKKIAARHPPKGSNPAADRGLQYERRIKRELAKLLALGNISAFEHNPWFQYRTATMTYVCSPDFVLQVGKEIYVAEIKLTWVPEAQTKLTDTYLPVTSKFYGQKTKGLIICRNLTPLAPPAKIKLHSALAQPEGLLHFPNIGPMIW